MIDRLIILCLALDNSNAVGTRAAVVILMRHYVFLFAIVGYAGAEDYDSDILCSGD